MRRAYALILIGVLLTGCGVLPVQPYRSSYDADRGVRHYYTAYAGFMDAPGWLAGGFRDGGLFELAAERRVTSQKTRHYLHLTLTADHWMLIEPGGSLVLRLDGERLALSSRAGSREARELKCPEYGPCRDIESARYPITPAQLRRIAQADRVTVQIHGDWRDVERQFPDAYQRVFRRFVERLITGQSV